MGYFDGRKKYSRPQGMMWADTDDIYNALNVPSSITDQSAVLITSDHNRSDIDVSTLRIETRDRMVNGRMRSFHTADKITVSCSWEMLPSRAFAGEPDFNLSTGISQNPLLAGSPQEFQHTVDGGAGGGELLDWYETHTGSFWVYLAYDKYKNFEGQEDKYAFLGVYNEGIEMFISDFSYNIVKRGNNNFDYWNVSVTLEEV